MSPLERARRLTDHVPQLLSICGTAVSALCTVTIVGRVLLVRDSNHWGFDIRLLWLVCLAAGALAVPILRSAKPWRACWPLTSAAVLAVVVAVFDHFNVLVEYGLWLARGMPTAGSAQAW
ncbi:MAG: hypothetical protein PVJ57_19340 [Phycisphaerae bacterium]